MRIGVLGTGTVGQTLGTKLASLGHEVTVGARDAFNDDSLAEQIQRAFAGARVVKALNTVTAAVMVDPSLVPGRHTMFLTGDDAGAKAQVTELLESFGWPRDDLL